MRWKAFTYDGAVVYGMARSLQVSGDALPSSPKAARAIQSVVHLLESDEIPRVLKALESSNRILTPSVTHEIVRGVL